MKTTVFSFILAIFMASINFVSAQTRQENRQIKDLESEITRLQSQANRLENQKEDTAYLVSLEGRINNSITALTSDTARRPILDIKIYQRAINELPKQKLLLEQIKADRKQASVVNQNLQLEINGLHARISQLEASRREIFDRYSTSEDIPRELTRNTTRRRLQANVVRREETSLEVLQNLPVYGDMVSGAVRLKVIVENNMIFDATFSIRPLNGGLPMAITLAPGSKEDVFLIPGDYMVIVTNNATGRLTGTGPLKVNRVVKNYKGEECHGFAATPRW